MVEKKPTLTIPSINVKNIVNNKKIENYK